jgi:hypothetical protein
MAKSLIQAKFEEAVWRFFGWCAVVAMVPLGLAFLGSGGHNPAINLGLGLLGLFVSFERPWE